MALKVVGQHKGLVSGLDLDTATVLDLKKAVSRDSGLPVAGLKLLAGGKHLKDDESSLATCGVIPGKTIMVLRQDLSEQVEAEASLNRRTEETVQAASKLSARAARDIGEGGGGRAWGRWGRGGGGERGGREGRGPGQVDRRAGRGGRGGNGDRREIELTNQDGEAMAIPPEDSAALMEGIMLHRQGLACIARTRTHADTPSTAGTGSSGGPAAVAGSPPEKLRSKKARRRSLSPLQQQQQQRQHQQQYHLQHQQQEAVAIPTPATTGTTTAAALAVAPTTASSTPTMGENGSNTDVARERERKRIDQEEHQSGGWEEQKESASTSLVLPTEQTVRGEGGGKEPDLGRGGGGGEGGKDVQDGRGPDAMDVESGDADHHTEHPAGGVVARKSSASTGYSGGGGGGDPATVRAHNRGALSAQENLIAQREALALLMKAEEAFRRCDPKYLEAVDNYAYLCLDIVWLLFLMKDMKNLDLASHLLAAVERGFLKAHGPGLQRLTALKGEHCAEKLLYVRLHLLQGVVAFLRGDSGTASALLIRASAEAKALRPNPALASRLMREWHAVKFEVLQPKVALRALRVGRNSLDAAWQYLENLRQRKDTVRKERERRAEQRRARRYGSTADKRGFVDAALVDQLARGGGFPRAKAVRALRQHNNDVGAALLSLTTTGSSRSGDRGGGGDGGGSGDEALAVLQSLGVPPEVARDVLERTGTLCNALRELGINAPEGVTASGASGGGSDGGGGGGGNKSDDSDGDGTSASGEEGASGGGDPGLDSEPTAEEKRLFDELAADKENQDDEGYLDVTLEDEADAADMYLLLCRGNVPVAFDLDKVRASVAAAAAAAAAATDGDQRR